MIFSRQAVEKIFIFFLIYLPIQYLLVGITGIYGKELWPAFVLPGFKNVYATHDYVEITEPKFYAEPADRSLSPVAVHASELFKGIPTSQLQGFLRSNFSQKIDFSSETKSWLKTELKRIYPEEEFVGLQVVWTPVVIYRGENLQKSTKEPLQIINISFNN